MIDTRHKTNSYSSYLISETPTKSSSGKKGLKSLEQYMSIRLTTIEEKSLGAIAKGGKAPIQAVYEYGVRPTVKGLVVMDSPGREPEILTGLAAAGCNVIAFATGRGAPQGFPFVPVVKLTGNALTWERMRDHMDLSVAGVIEGSESLPEAGERIVRRILEVASGERTRAEITGYTRAMDIYVTGPVI